MRNMEVAFEEGAGVLKVLFGVGFGGGDALKRFVRNPDDPLLLGSRFRVTDFEWSQVRSCNLRLCRPSDCSGNVYSATEKILQETEFNRAVPGANHHRVPCDPRIGF